MLFLSATPLEETYEHIWNQLDVFGLGEQIRRNCDDRLLTEEEKKEVAGKFLVRRVTSMRIAGEDRTKNHTDASGGAAASHQHDEPIAVDGRAAAADRRAGPEEGQRAPGSRSSTCRSRSACWPRSRASWKRPTQASRRRRKANFDDAEQTRTATEREGIDVRDVNSLARDYRRRSARRCRIRRWTRWSRIARDGLDDGQEGPRVRAACGVGRRS